MPLTPAQAMQILRTRSLTIGPDSDGQWIATTKGGGRLHREPKSSPEDAIEAADLVLKDAESRSQQAEHSRIYGVLETGAVYARPLAVPVEGGHVYRWDIVDTLTGTFLVESAESLAGAVTQYQDQTRAARGGAR